MALFLAQHRSAGRRRAADASAGRGFGLLLLVTLGAFANYAPLLSVVPLWSARGGAGNGGAGAATGVTMAATVAMQFAMGRLLRRYPATRLLAVGVLVLGLPTFGYLLSAEAGWVLGISAVRGIGFGMLTVAGSSLIAGLVPAHRRGRAVGLYGVATGLPQVLCLPLGVWCSEHLGFGVVFVATGAVSVLAAPLAWLITTRRAAAPEEPPERPAAAQRNAAVLGRLLAPLAALFACACALGGVTSFLPLAMPRGEAAPLALLVLSAAMIAGRWAAGVFSDRFGPGRLLVPAGLGSALGCGGLALAVGGPAGSGVWAAAAAAVFGAGFGILQNDAMLELFRRAGPDGNGLVSTAWNAAYDAGSGAGAVAVGVLSQGLGIEGALLAVAAVILAVSPVAGLSRRTR
jgi:predicted MFS family arabinose efflux permease